jgi:hypothetical protein
MIKPDIVLTKNRPNFYYVSNFNFSKILFQANTTRSNTHQVPTAAIMQDAGIVITVR